MQNIATMDTPKIEERTKDEDQQLKLKTIMSANPINPMTSSVASILDDTTPDSGVQLLSVVDSETSELNESMISSLGFDLELTPVTPSENVKRLPDCSQIPDLLLPAAEMTRSDIDNNNKFDPPDIASVCEGSAVVQYPDALISSTHSTFDTENTEIVYRRRIKKPAGKAAVKKRVSFHEDILKNTRTDNIHIEHGFITYKSPRINKPNARYSWCNEYSTHQQDEEEPESDECTDRVYRNAVSDVLEYGKSTMEANLEHKSYDNSGIFEYGCSSRNKREFYKCSCSNSNSSIESNSSGSPVKDQNKTENIKRNYKQAKSNSCDCIGTDGSSSSSADIGKTNCYFSEPSFEHLNEFNGSTIWKEKKPKSCLKKTKRVSTNVVPDANHHPQKSKVLKKFNVHQLSDMNQLIGNSKMLIGSLKDIFGITLPERGVPEGSEDIHPVVECMPAEVIDNENFTIINKPKYCLSKSLDGVNKNKRKNFVHNVDEQMRRKNDEDLFAPSRKNSLKVQVVEPEPEEQVIPDEEEEIIEPVAPEYRNKFIINCESTVFEHTGTCFETESSPFKEPPIHEPASSNPFKKKLSSIFKSFADIGSKKLPELPERDFMVTSTNSNISPVEVVEVPEETKDDPIISEFKGFEKMRKSSVMESSIISSCSDKNSIVSDITLTSHASSSCQESKNEYSSIISDDSSQARGSRHISSPMRKQKPNGMQFMPSRSSSGRLSPDLFNPGPSSSKISLEDFEDILTITTDVTNEADDIVIVDYADIRNDSLSGANSVSNYYLKLPSIMTSSTTSTASKTSLINRFLRNVTQKKILEATIKKNDFFQAKLSKEKKLFGGNLYVKGVLPKDDSLIQDLNAEIALEIEMGSNSLEAEKNSCEEDTVLELGSLDRRFEGGVGEVKIDIFDIKCLNILRNDDEVLMKAYKLYTGYSNEGCMTAVLVFLTDKTLYVTDLVRNRLCNKFVLPYSELDVILMGPYGNTVLLSNNARDMQQVLLAGGPYPADKLVASLELCARRGGSILPAVGQLTLDHLAPLKVFVCDNSSVPRDDSWKYYAIVNVPAGSLGIEQEPMGPHLSGPLMHRSMSHSGAVQMWAAGYFMLKAGVLYLFNDAGQKIPSWAVALTECQGARRSLNTTRPHCFEILLRTGQIQLAAPDEYVASDWLQGLVQAASGLFEVQEKNKTLGCTLIMTNNHLITLREDFSSPLRRIVPNQPPPAQMIARSLSKENVDPSLVARKMSNSTMLDTSSEVSSIKSNPSTPSRNCRTISTISTPTRIGSAKKSITTFLDDSKSYTNMTSFYGKNSGVDLLTCASISEMTSIKIPADSNNWWCTMEFSCQEVRENSDDLVVFFATSMELQRFLEMLEFLWHSKMDTPFPVNVIDANDEISEHCEKLFVDINRSWDPLLSASLALPK